VAQVDANYGIAMSCENIRPFIGAYIDDEFDEREAAEFEAHIESCAECREELEEQLRVKRVVRGGAGDVEAPDELKQEILAGMSEIDAERERDEAASHGRSRVIAALAAIVPLGLGIVAVFWFTNLMTVAPATSSQPPAIEQTVEWHRNALPLEVQGPDRSHVAEWFRGKVSFPVRIPEFSDEGVELKGGRIAHVKDRRASYLSYHVNGARMSVMMFHGEGFKVPTEKIRHVQGRELALFSSEGYVVAMLQDEGLTYTITSELSEEELLRVISSALDEQ